MSLLPNKNLIIVTSALTPVNQGAVSPENRYLQTLDSLVSLRKHFPNDIIFFTDGSSFKIEKEKIEKIQEYCDFLAIWNEDEDIKTLSSAGLKSQTEIVLLYKSIISLLQNPELQKVLYGVKRIYKFSARSVLHDNFDPKSHEVYGKYIFKKRIMSWLPEQKQKDTTDHLLITRMYSFCPSLISNYLQTLGNCFSLVNSTGVDTEHAHYKYIDKKYLVEFDKLGLDGIVAGSGAIEIY